MIKQDDFVKLHNEDKEIYNEITKIKKAVKLIRIWREAK